MQQVQDANASECFADDMGQDTGIRLSVHGCESGGDIEQLGKRIDRDEDVADVESAGIPCDHPC